MSRMAAVAGLALVLAGCELSLGVDLTVDRRGAGTLAVAVTADRELLQRAAEAGAAPLDDLAATGAALSDDGWTVQDTTRPSGTREVVLRVAFADPEELATLSAQLAQALEAPEVDLLEPLELQVGEREVRLAGSAGLVPTQVVTDYGVTPEEAVRLLEESGALRYRIAAAFPGEVLDATGSVEERSTVTWEVAPGERVEIRATSTRPGLPLLPLAAGAAAGAAAAAAGATMLRRRRRAHRRIAA